MKEACYESLRTIAENIIDDVASKANDDGTTNGNTSTVISNGSIN